MTATNAFFIWFFTGLDGLGGWFIFFLMGFIAFIVVWYDSQRRRLPAIGWRMGVLLTAALILPAMFYRFANPTTQESLQQFTEVIFYLGLLGGVLPPVLAIGYFVTFQGLVGCPQGHVYEAKLGECPICARQRMAALQAVVPAQTAPPPPPASYPQQTAAPVAPPPPSKPKAAAWLVGNEGRTYQLYIHETTIGRSSRNDIVLSDSTVSKQHAKIVERNGHFWLYDLGSTNGTRLNGHLLRQPTMLEPDDTIQFGDRVVLRFVTTRS